MTEEAKAEAKTILQGWGVIAWPSVMQRLERGEITVQDIIEVDEYASEHIDIAVNERRPANFGGGLFYDMLFVPGCVESRRVWAEDRRAANARREAKRNAQDNAEREASAERHRLLSAVTEALAAPVRKMSELVNKPEAVEKIPTIQKNIERVNHELGSTVEAIAKRLSESQRVEIATLPDPRAAFKRLANIAKDIESGRAQAQTMRAEFKNRTAQGVAQ